MDIKVLEPYSNIEFRKKVCSKCDDKERCNKTDSDIQICLSAFTPLEVE